MTDNELHSLVRETLQGYEPIYQPQHWGVMRKQLHQNKWKKRGIIFFVSIIAFFILLIINNLNYFGDKKISNQTFEPAMKPQIDSSSPEIIRKQEEEKPDNETAIREIVKKQEKETTSQEVKKLLIDSIITQEHQFNLSFLPKDTVDLGSFFVEQQIRNYIKNNFISSYDSTVYKVFDRNKHLWKNAVVICDWTSSMYEYGAQVLVLLNQLKQENYIKGFVFFNDCDSLGKQTKSGRGKHFYTKSSDLEIVIQAMKQSVKYGKNNLDYAENDLSAVVFAMQQFTDAENFILIADNKSEVKDMYLLGQIKKPLKIVLCGETFFSDKPIQPHYQLIAQRTKSSLHTIENDIPSLKKLKNKSKIRIGNTIWEFKNGNFKRLK